MSKAPAFQFYVKDWLSSLSITLMTAEQEGGYIRLLCYCWDSGDCSLPSNIDQLIAMSRISKGGWDLVGKCFVPHPEKEGFLTNLRLYQELQKQRAWLAKSSIGGKKSAKQRAEKRNNLKGGSQMVEEWLQPKSNIASASASASAKDLSAFVDFWKVFPKQRAGSKDKAGKAYESALLRTTHHTIMAAVTAYAASDEVARGFAKGCAAWLNDDRWTHDYKNHLSQTETKDYNRNLG